MPDRDDQSPVVLDRQCGTCTLCCKVLSITELQKPKGIWCKHCDVGKGCRIYEGRPNECQSFYCGYLTQSDLDERWKPSTSKIILVAELEGGGRIAAHVDPGRSDAWRRKFYYEELKRWATLAVEHQGQVVVCVNKRTIVILPDQDVDLGIVEDDELIVNVEREGPMGTIYDAIKIKDDDPRASRVRLPGKPPAR